MRPPTERRPSTSVFALLPLDDRALVWFTRAELSKSPELIVLLDTSTMGVALTAVPFGELVVMFATADVGLLRRTRVQKHVLWHVGNSSLSKLRVESVFVSCGVGVGCNGASYKGTTAAPDFDLSRTSVTVKLEVGLRVLLKEEEVSGVGVGVGAL